MRTLLRRSQRRSGWLCSLAAMVLVGLSLWLIRTPRAMSAAAAKPAAPPLPPLVIDKSAPLLLDSPSATEGDVAPPQTTLNAACFVCHENYAREELANVHAAEEIGCVECHGQSFAHRNDENNTTPPDVMFAPQAIAAACQKCHETHDAPAAAVVARWQQRCPQKTDVSQIVCTDCHGEHRLAWRTVRWDKTTRELLPPQEPAVPNGPQPPAETPAVPQ